MENILQKSPTGKLQWERNVNILKQVCLKFKFFFSCSQGNHNSFEVIALELLLAKIFHGGGGGLQRSWSQKQNETARCEIINTASRSWSSHDFVQNSD